MCLDVINTAMKKVDRYLALSKALKPVYQTGRSFHMAFAFYKGKLLASACNNYLKSSKISAKYKKDNAVQYTACNHAEFNLIRKIKATTNIPYSKITILVIRIDNNNQVADSKPCDNCMNHLDLKKFKSVYFTNQFGEIISNE